MTKAPPERGFLRCAEEDSNLHPVIPDQALNTVRTCPIRAFCSMRSILSTRGNTLDALDDLDVVTGVVAIRDQGLVARVPRTLAGCRWSSGALRVHTEHERRRRSIALSWNALQVRGPTTDGVAYGLIAGAGRQRTRMSHAFAVAMWKATGASS
jgi:hypothetical protein